MTTETADPWSQLAGQTAAVEQLRASAAAPVHAYLLVGPEGVGKREAARIFAAAVLSDGFSAPDTDRTWRLAQSEQLADLTVIEPEGRAFLVADAQRAIQAANQPPVEKQRKVIVLDRFHTANPEVAPSLLKTIEEPQPSVIMVVLAQQVPREHETIASRCVQINFAALSAADIKAWLLANAELQLDEALASQLAEAAQGNQRRAKLLANDSGFRDRLWLWQQAPLRCGTNGADATALVDELMSCLEDSQSPLLEAQQQELAQQAEEAEKFQISVGDKKALDARHRRELRQFREAELRWGLSVLAHSYWRQLEQELHGAGVGTGNGGGADGADGDSNGSGERTAERPRQRGRPGREMLTDICTDAVARLRAVQTELGRNPFEALLLQNLFRQLPYLDVS